MRSYEAGEKITDKGQWQPECWARGTFILQ